MLQIKRIHSNAMMPTRATEHSAGLDLYASEGAYLPAHASTRVHTGIMLAVPVGYEVQVRSRSGLAAKHGVHVLNSPGTIDADYRGEVQVILRNASNDPFRFWAGERVAQLVIARVEMWTPEEVDELPQTTRGIGGFGSTGR